MPGVLERVLEAFATRRDEIARRARTAAPSTLAAGADSTPSVDALVASVFQSYDPRYGGFGTAPKFPLTAPLHLALELHRSSGDAGMCAIVECSLDAMITRGLYDAVDGGFFRYATMRDWQQPHQEKLLDVNAAMLRLFVDAETALKAARYRDVARGVIRYVQTSLADMHDGGWAGSQAASESYYACPTQEARRAAEAPPVDRTIYTGWNAAMISAALHAAAATEDTELGEFAIRSLERVVLACYQPGAGVAHYFDGQPRVRGLLDDQVAMANAALDAAEATGRVPYEMLAEELALFAQRTMWDEHEGGFFDRAAAPGDECVGRLRERVKPFVSNCEAARMLARLAASSGDHDFAARAREALEAMAPFAAREGPLAAHYLRAMRETTYGFR